MNVHWRPGFIESDVKFIDELIKLEENLQKRYRHVALIQKGEENEGKIEEVPSH